VKFRQIRKQFIRLLINFGTSGKYSGELKFGMSDYLIRYVLMNFICIFGIAILLGFISLRFSEGKYGTVAACSVMVLIALVTIILSRSKMVSQIVPSATLMIFYALLCIAITWLGEAAGSNYLFLYVYPLLTIMMLGMRLGVIFSVALPVLVFVEMAVPGLSRFSYPITVPIHMLVTYSLVFFVMVVIENTRKTKDRFIEIQNKRLHELMKEAEAANRTKSNFLASMSHEIRTPMNAITGMAELLLRGELSGEARGYAQDIKQAGNNLISIINDILDFSKIEAGKMELVPVKYLLASLVNDSVNIIRMRIAEKPIRFFTNIDGNIPSGLIGDEVRLRQIILNLLSNAVKYTEKGHISLSITVDKRTDKQIWLRIVITDTGKGIKPEDQEKLFGDFVQVDSRKNRGIEGTGLGLAITRRLCLIMGGDISVESEYGSGSVFTAFIPQGIDSDVPFAMVNEPEKKKILVYEGRIVYAKSVCWSLENLRVPYTMVTNPADFTEALQREEWFFVFSGYGLYDKIKTIMDNAVFPNGKKPPLALMVEFGNEPYIPDVRFVSLPIQSLSIANTLNGNADSRNYFINAGNGGTIRFTYSGARLLVVDDIATNLKVAEGLLAPYKAEVDTCLNGLQAMELVKRATLEMREYDVVFMDHMMPEMDGIETTAAIRALEGECFKAMPIVALTANAVVGMREMFIEKGFNDFLSKPIDVGKLDEILNRWIPKEKREAGKEDSKAAKAENEKKLVILVDDNPANLRIGKNVLAEKYAVATAPSAEKLFGLLENNHPAIILLDIDMPVMNGYEAIKKLKSKPETKNIPVIFLTAKTESDDELEGLSMGAIDYITKPFNPALLLKRIEVHLLVQEQRKTLEKQASDLQYFNKNLRQAFSTYLSEDVVEEIVSDPTRLQLGGVKRDMTALFTDVKDFTRIAEALPPEQLVDLLNYYLSSMSDIILGQKGTIDKYEGDAIISFFGAPLDLPDHVIRACTTAVVMKRVEKEINRHIMEKQISPSLLLTRIGISSGEMIVGNMGTKKKMNYTIVGNVVNLAARLEGVNKQYGTWILATEDTVRQTGGRFLTRRLDRIRVIGINEPVRIYEVMELNADASEALHEKANSFQQAHELFEKRIWTEAEKIFNHIVERSPGDGPSLLYLNRCRQYLLNPPANDWDGVFDINEK